MDSQKSFFDFAAWRYFLAFYRNQALLIFFSSVGSAAQSLVVLPTLFLIRYLFDVAIPQNNVHLLVLAGLGIFGFRLINSGISLWLRAINIRIINRSIFLLREDLLKKLYTFSRSFHTREDQKIIHTRIVQDTERLSNMSNTLMSRLFPSLFTSLALCFVLLFLNWFLVLVMITIFPVLFITNRYSGKLVKERVFVFQRAIESFSKGIWFVLRYMDLTRIQGAEDKEIVKQTISLRELQTQTGRMSFIFAIHGQIQQTLTSLSGIVIIIIGGAFVANGRMTMGEFLSFYVAAIFLYNHVDTITTSIADIINGNESLITLHGLAQTRDLQPYQGKKLIEFRGFISLESVSFAYERQAVLKSVNLKIVPDSKMAIIGSNGAGKSTLVELILGFYAPNEGQLTADGIPYEELDLVNLRRSIGVVTQNPPLFSGTILENVSYGASEVGRDRIVEACRFALADDFIRQLPDGYDTQIGDDGVLLSGGECQRLAIARALLRRPKLLILDEPTNHLDGSTVARLLDSLDRLDDNLAILIISHDVSVVQHAIEIWRINKGELTAVMSDSRDFPGLKCAKKVS
jgi:ABC-type multidrug transport system fused ATPase/permease subunit